MKKRYVAAFTDVRQMSLIGREYAVQFGEFYLVGFEATFVSTSSLLFKRAHTILRHSGRAVKSYDGTLKKSHLAKVPALLYVDADRFSIV